MKLVIIIGSTREGRTSDRLAKWIHQTAQAKEGVEAELVDLRDYPMPFFNEPISPRYNPNRVVAPEVQPWLAKLQAADAYVFVTPEYNHAISGVLKNSLDYVTWELVHKPAAVAGHGAMGGTRALMNLKTILSESRAAVIPGQVAIAGMHEKIDADGNLADDLKTMPYGPQTQLDALLSDLQWYSDALAAARQ